MFNTIADVTEALDCTFRRDVRAAGYGEDRGELVAAAARILATEYIPVAHATASNGRTAFACFVPARAR